MIRYELRGWTLPLVLGGLLLAAGAGAQTAPQPPKASKHAKAPKEAAKTPPAPALEPKAIDLLKAASSRLAAARSMAFTAVVSYENPSVFGPAPRLHDEVGGLAAETGQAAGDHHAATVRPPSSTTTARR